MTKRNLLLVSLLLVFGLAATAPSLFAAAAAGTGVVFAGSNNTNYFIRNEGDAEGVGTITLATASTGTIRAGSAFYITYNAPLAHAGSLYAVGITCTGDFADAVCAQILPFTVAANPGGGAINEVVLTFANDVPLGTPVTGTQIAIAVRVMAQGLAFNQAVLATVRAYYLYSAYPMTIAPLYPAPYEVAQVGPSVALSVAFKEGPPTVLTCIGVKDIDYYDNDFSLRLTENWPNALTSLSDEFNLEWDTIVPAPSNGSNILITLSGIPDGVGVGTKDYPYTCSEYPSGPHGCPGGNLSIEYVTDSGLVCSGGLCTDSFLFQVDTTSTGTVENAVFDFKLWSHGPLAPNMNYQIMAQVDLVDYLPSTAGDMPYFTADELSTPISVVEFKDCVTKLLFPYVNTYAAGGTHAFSNFDTGIAISNTTKDPFALKDATGAYIYPDEAKGSAVPQTGNCILYLYPMDGSGPMAPALIPATGTIPAGGSFVFGLADYPTTKAFKGQQGYAIAICNFQNAHAFVEIWDNAGIGDPTATLAYLGEVIPDPAFYHRSPAGDALGEGAIAPINIGHLIQKLLMYNGDISSYAAAAATSPTSALRRRQ